MFREKVKGILMMRDCFGRHLEDCVRELKRCLSFGQVTGCIELFEIEFMH